MTEVIRPEDIFKTQLKNMSFADLHAMYIFVSGDFNKQFGIKLETKKIIHERYKMIQDELNERVYGCDPYAAGKLEIEGDKPEDIDLSKYEDGKETK